MADSIRIGRISSIDYQKGTVKVVYADKDNAVTDSLPLLNMNGEYKMPNINDMVLVAHLSNGVAMGIVMGTFWSKGNPPAETGKNLFRKELGRTPGEAYIRYDASTNVLKIKADTVQIVTDTGTTNF